MATEVGFYEWNMVSSPFFDDRDEAMAELLKMIPMEAAKGAPEGAPFFQEITGHDGRPKYAAKQRMLKYSKIR